MAYESSFFDNQIIGVDHLNKLAQRFVTSGIADQFENGIPYNVSKINDIIVANGSSGVVPSSVNTLKVTKSGGSSVLINIGTAFFHNGATIDVTEPETLSYSPGVPNYVYLKCDTALNRAFPACTTNEPTGDFVLLAEISSSGEITDKRTYAKGKLPGYQSNSNTRLDFNISISGNKDGQFYDYTGLSYDIDLGVNNYSYLVFDNGNNLESGASGSLTRYCLDNNSFICAAYFSNGGMDFSNDKIYISTENSYGIKLTIQKIGSIVRFSPTGRSSAASSISIRGFVC